MRVARVAPWTETFEGFADGAVPPGWISVTTGRMAVGTLDGQKVLVKAPDETIFKRFRAFVGPVEMSNYTVEADVRGTTRRRQMANMGVTAQRYSLMIYGNTQEIKIEPWEPEIHRSAVKPFEWKADTWYHLKLRVENGKDGKTRISGKSWVVSEPEPDKWQLEYTDPTPNVKGAAGLFADAQFGVSYDNIKIYANK